MTCADVLPKLIATQRQTGCNCAAFTLRVVCLLTGSVVLPFVSCRESIFVVVVVVGIGRR